MKIPTLRDCQSDLIDAIGKQFLEHRRVVARADTGFGKTIVFCAIAARAMKKGKRVVIVAHRVEIVDQISRALDSFGVRHGRIQTGHTMTDDPIQVCMVVTAAKRIDRIPEPDLLVIDECHHAVAASWATIANAWQKARILGVTATPIRTDGRGLSEAFDVMVQAIPMAELIAAGYLSDYVYLAPPQMVDLSSIKSRAGDYAKDDLSAAMDKPVITGDAIAHARKHLQGKPSIAFCVSVEHAEHVAQQFREAGLRADSVDGAMEKSERRDRIAAIGDGRLDVLTSCDIISEGTDIPVVGGAILLRPTKSLSMHLQQVGRVLRSKPDGSRAVILDHVGNGRRHGLPDQHREWSLDGEAPKKRKKKDEEQAESVRQCPECYAMHKISPVCPECNHVYKIKSRQVEQQDGELVEVNRAEIEQMRAAPLRQLLAKADTVDDLRAIAKARGYAPGWVAHQLRIRHQRRTGVAA